MGTSETSLFRHLTAAYCQGTGVDLGSGGDPVVPTAIQVDLADPYTKVGDAPIQIRGDARFLWWFQNQVLDYVYSSHLLEDYPAPEWPRILREWVRVLKRGGFLVILVPDRRRFRAAVAAGQPDNLAHQHEPCVGELTRHAEQIDGLEVIYDDVADADHYSILFVARKRPI